MTTTAIVLGPQRRQPIVCEAVDSLVPDRKRPVAVVTAGWEERETEDGELREHVCRPVDNLRIWTRVERIFERDHELLEAMRERHTTLRRVQELYRVRLGGLMEAIRELMRRGEDDALVAAELNDAWVMVRGLDEQHMARVAEVHHEFEQRVQPWGRAAVVRERRELEKQLAAASCLLVAGGHIGVLLHRLRLFDLCRLWGQRPFVAWSAGAMAFTERIVLFHDTPPQGSTYAEVMEQGFGSLPGFVALPHARHRLQTDDPLRVQLLARRFAPALCALLDPGSRFDLRGGAWVAAKGARQLVEDGTVAEASA